MANLPDSPEIVEHLVGTIEKMASSLGRQMIERGKLCEAITDIRTLRARDPKLPNLRITVTVETCEGDV